MQHGAVTGKTFQVRAGSGFAEKVEQVIGEFWVNPTNNFGFRVPE